MSNHFRILILFSLITGANIVSYAQESGFPPEEVERSSEVNPPVEEWNVREGGMISPEGSTTTKNERKSDELVAPNVPKLNVRQTDPSTTSKQAESVQTAENTADDESVLSFNFLYYLIQKFKFDSVD